MLLCSSHSTKESAGIEKNGFSYYSHKYKMSKHIKENNRSITEKRKDKYVFLWQVIFCTLT